MVGATGIEPVTPSMSRKCSPAELRALVSRGPAAGVQSGRSIAKSEGFASPAQALDGTVNSSFYRFNISGEQWLKLPSTPLPWVNWQTP